MTKKTTMVKDKMVEVQIQRLTCWVIVYSAISKHLVKIFCLKITGKLKCLSYRKAGKSKRVFWHGI